MKRPYLQRLQISLYTIYNIRLENLDHKILYRQEESSLPQRLYYKLYKQTSKIIFPFVFFVHGSFLENLLFVKLKCYQLGHKKTKTPKNLQTPKLLNRKPHKVSPKQPMRIIQLSTLKERNPHLQQNLMNENVSQNSISKERRNLLQMSMSSLIKKNFIENFIQHTTFSSKKRQYTGRGVVHCGYRNKIKYWKRM